MNDCDECGENFADVTSCTCGRVPLMTRDNSVGAGEASGVRTGSGGLWRCGLGHMYDEDPGDGCSHQDRVDGSFCGFPVFEVELCGKCGHPEEEDCICVSVEAISLGWEAKTGADSIPTIERVYERTGTNSQSGAYICVWPGCAFKRVDPEKLWRHVHTAHGENSLPPADFDPGPWL